MVWCVWVWWVRVFHVQNCSCWGFWRALYFQNSRWCYATNDRGDRIPKSNLVGVISLCPALRNLDKLSFMTCSHLVISVYLVSHMSVSQIIFLTLLLFICSLCLVLLQVAFFAHGWRSLEKKVPTHCCLTTKSLEPVVFTPAQLRHLTKEPKLLYSQTKSCRFSVFSSPEKVTISLRSFAKSTAGQVGFSHIHLRFILYSFSTDIRHKRGKAPLLHWHHMVWD